MDIGNQPTASNDTFAACLKQVRVRIDAKQFWLAGEIGCSEAAVSLWENGSRLPRQNTMRRVFHALEKGGALPAELVSLLVAWRNDRNKTQRGTSRRVTDLQPVAVF
jgi:DNA-binding XRE family transcriptional regulator